MGPSRGTPLGHILSAASATGPRAAPHLCQYLFLPQPPTARILLKGREQMWQTLHSASWRFCAGGLVLGTFHSPGSPPLPLVPAQGSRPEETFLTSPLTPLPLRDTPRPVLWLHIHPVCTIGLNSEHSKCSSNPLAAAWLQTQVLTSPGEVIVVKGCVV